MAGRQGRGGTGRYAYICSQPYDFGERSDLPNKDEIQVLPSPVINKATYLSTLMQHVQPTRELCVCRQPGQAGAGGMTKAELQVGFCPVDNARGTEDVGTVPNLLHWHWTGVSLLFCCRRGWKQASARGPKIVRKTLQVLHAPLYIVSSPLFPTCQCSSYCSHPCMWWSSASHVHVH